MFTGFLLIGVRIALVRREMKDTRSAVKNPIGLPVMIEAVGRAVGTQTVTMKSNTDNIMEKLTALQRQMYRKWTQRVVV